MKGLDSALDVRMGALKARLNAAMDPGITKVHRLVRLYDLVAAVRLVIKTYEQEGVGLRDGN
jgi:hypothetical protein